MSSVTSSYKSNGFRTQSFSSSAPISGIPKEEDKKIQDLVQGHGSDHQDIAKLDSARSFSNESDIIPYGPSRKDIILHRTTSSDSNRSSSNSSHEIEVFEKISDQLANSTSGVHKRKRNSSSSNSLSETRGDSEKSSEIEKHYEKQKSKAKEVFNKQKIHPPFLTTSHSSASLKSLTTEQKRDFHQRQNSLILKTPTKNEKNRNEKDLSDSVKRRNFLMEKLLEMVSLNQEISRKEKRLYISYVDIKGEVKLIWTQDKKISNLISSVKQMIGYMQEAFAEEIKLVRFENRLISIHQILKDFIELVRSKSANKDKLKSLKILEKYKKDLEEVEDRKGIIEFSNFRESICREIHEEQLTPEWCKQKTFSHLLLSLFNKVEIEDRKNSQELYDLMLEQNAFTSLEISLYYLFITPSAEQFLENLYNLVEMTNQKIVRESSTGEVTNEQSIYKILNFQERILSFLRDWISYGIYPQNLFLKESDNNARRWIEEKIIPAIEKNINSNELPLLIKELEARIEFQKNHVETLIKYPKGELERKIDKYEAASDFTHLVTRLTKKLNISEVFIAMNHPELEVIAPSWSLYCDYYNYMTNFIVESILKDSPAEVIQAIEFFAEVAIQCLKEHDFYSASALHGALTKNLLNPFLVKASVECNKSIKKLSEYFSPLKNNLTDSLLHISSKAQDLYTVPPPIISHKIAYTFEEKQIQETNIKALRSLVKSLNQYVDLKDILTHLPVEFKEKPLDDTPPKTALSKSKKGLIEFRDHLNNYLQMKNCSEGFNDLLQRLNTYISLNLEVSESNEIESIQTLKTQMEFLQKEITSEIKNHIEKLEHEIAELQNSIKGIKDGYLNFHVCKVKSLSDTLKLIYVARQLCLKDQGEPVTNLPQIFTNYCKQQKEVYLRTKETLEKNISLKRMKRNALDMQLLEIQISQSSKQKIDQAIQEKKKTKELNIDDLEKKYMRLLRKKIQLEDQICKDEINLNHNLRSNLEDEIDNQFKKKVEELLKAFS
ncbi:MAG: hypothetical protein BGO14_00095 [Chlamydiales bacterium 38-26]|nr:hypothetical protein [Chlamydiales bacterium]OJV07467.1 MAG: hypothetical protein BGO14_00095 [Chlamydiales bacterium 38-26]